MKNPHLYCVVNNVTTHVYMRLAHTSDEAINAYTYATSVPREQLSAFRQDVMYHDGQRYEIVVRRTRGGN